MIFAVKMAGGRVEVVAFGRVETVTEHLIVVVAGHEDDVNIRPQGTNQLSQLSRPFNSGMTTSVSSKSIVKGCV